ncbi:MAG: carbon monoxide dehydrogenase, partial [Chloroflexi bacterium]|nr:carbon monoxide dehydrogenase [Chloroflexota bacterium]
FVDSLSGNYAYMVMDNEAGMEHLSRRTTQNVDVLLIISNHSVKGVRTIARIRKLVGELRLRVGKELVIVNLVPDKVDPLIAGELSRLGIKPAAFVPEDELIYKYDLEVKPLVELPDSSVAVRAIDDLMVNVLSKN